MRFHTLLAVMRCPCEILRFLVHTFRGARYPDEISCFLDRYELAYETLCFAWSSCDFLMRFHAFWLHNFLFDGVI
jgi:hypothetical protein